MSESAPIYPAAETGALARAVVALQGGACIGMPTETVYGLACDALNPLAVARVFEAKQRPSFDPLIVHVRDFDHARELVIVTEAARALARRFWPGPLTMVLPRFEHAPGYPVVPDLVTAGLPNVGVRAPSHPVAQRLLRESGLALAAPSANRFGSVSPTTARHVADELGDKPQLIIDGGPCTHGVESTVVAFGTGEPDNADGGAVVRVLRLGAVAVEALAAALPGYAIRVTPPTSRPGAAGEDDASDRPRAAPGMTDRHYAPRTPMHLFADNGNGLRPAPTGRWGLVVLRDPGPDAAGYAEVRVLSAAGDLAQAAAGLFAVMRELDGLGLDGIVAVGVPDNGIGRAINDRLRRASVAGD